MRARWSGGAVASSRRSARSVARSSLGALVAAVSLSSMACMSTERSLQARFASERGCPEDEVTVAESRGVDYHVSGCGQSADYVCGAVATLGSAPACELRDAQKPGDKPPPYPPDAQKSSPLVPGMPTNSP